MSNRDDIFKKSEYELSYIIEKCQKFKESGRKYCSGTLHYDLKEYRDYSYEYLKSRLNSSQYNFKKVQLKKQYVPTVDDSYRINYYISWLEKTHSLKTSDFDPSERGDRPLKELESVLDNIADKRAYRKERKRQFNEMHPNWGCIKGLLIFIAVIIFLIIFW